MRGPSAHLTTTVTPKGTSLELDDPAEEFHAIARQYHGDDGRNGFAVADAKALIEQFLAARKTLSDAMTATDGIWRNEQ